MLGLNPPFHTGLEGDAVFDPPASSLENPGGKSVLLPLTPWNTLESHLKWWHSSSIGSFFSISGWSAVFYISNFNFRASHLMTPWNWEIITKAGIWDLWQVISASQGTQDFHLNLLRGKTRTSSIKGQRISQSRSLEGNSISDPADAAPLFMESCISCFI